jgi:hypothetical protein
LFLARIARQMVIMVKAVKAIIGIVIKPSKFR